MAQVFDDTGLLRSNASIPAITELRQVFYLFYKVELPFDKAQLSAAMLKFKEVDASIGTTVPFLKPKHFAALVYAEEFITQLFEGFDPKDIIPSHGPGVVASGERPHEKRVFSTKYKVIHDVYPYYGFFYINPHHLLCTVRHYRRRSVKEVGINKVLFVPKDSRGPRTIACEPLEYQWLQQGLRRSLYQWIENHPLSRGRINFTDQSVNQELARLASIDDHFATIDLSDASDRVSVWLVARLFAGQPYLLKHLLALRSPHSRLPDGELVHLNKYAAQGSALCFPIEAICFYALAVGCARAAAAVSQTYVYGDDIIIPKRYACDYISLLEELRLKVNREKSCISGPFKESCGTDYFRGVLVTPIKLRTVSASSPADIASLVSTSNQLFDKGFYKTSLRLESLLQRFDIPFGKPNSPYLAYWSTRWDPPISLNRSRINVGLQVYERRVPVLTGVSYSDPGLDTLQRYGEYLRKVTQGWSPEFVAGSYAKRHKTRIRHRYVEIHK
jgi:hypothetical protein